MIATLWETGAGARSTSWCAIGAIARSSDGRSRGLSRARVVEESRDRLTPRVSRSDHIVSNTRPVPVRPSRTGCGERLTAALVYWVLEVTARGELLAAAAMLAIGTAGERDHHRNGRTTRFSPAGLELRLGPPMVTFTGACRTRRARGRGRSEWACASSSNQAWNTPSEQALRLHGGRIGGGQLGRSPCGAWSRDRMRRVYRSGDPEISRAPSKSCFTSRAGCLRPGGARRNSVALQLEETAPGWSTRCSRCCRPHGRTRRWVMQTGRVEAIPPPRPGRTLRRHVASAGTLDRLKTLYRPYIARSMIC